MPVDASPPRVPRLLLGARQPVDAGQSTSSSATSLIANASSSRDEGEELRLYRQALPLVHARSMAAAKTLRKMLPNTSDMSKRMLRRSVDAAPGDCSRAWRPGNRGDGAWSKRQLEFVATCERMLAHFSSLDGRAEASARGVAKARVRHLLAAFALHVDAAAFRQWEQSLPAETTLVSLRMLVQACRLWFGERFLIDHVRARLPRPDDRSDDRSDASASAASELAVSRAHGRLVDQPFSKMARASEAAAAFDYRAYADSPPTIVCAPSRAEPPQSCGRRHALAASASAPALPSASASASPSRQPPALTRAAATARQRRLGGQLARARDADMARAFSASVAMISRHVQNEEAHDAREARRERQRAKVDGQRQWSQLHRAHCQARAAERAQQQQQQAAAMQALAREEQQLQREAARARLELLRRHARPLALSASTSTVFAPPPEILAARATAKTPAERQRLLQLEREHRAHMRSLQLLDYVFDKQQAVLEALRPKADAALISVGDGGDGGGGGDELPMAAAAERDALWRELLDRQAAAGRDLCALLVPPPNSPPAALRFFGASRAVALPPFSSGAPRELA